MTAFRYWLMILLSEYIYIYTAIRSYTAGSLQSIFLEDRFKFG